MQGLIAHRAQPAVYDRLYHGKSEEQMTGIDNSAPC
jgi:hypothetical protein